MKKKLLAIMAAAALPAFATDKLILEDFDYVLSGNTSITNSSSYLAAFWGTYSGSVFTPIAGVNNGYFAISGDDSLASYSATSNTIAAVVQIYLGIFDVANGSQFSAVTASTKRVILTDSTWTVPAFDTSPGTKAVNFTAGTTAALGTYAFGSGGIQSIGLASLAAVPEPSTYAACFGLAVLGFAAGRRRRG